MEVFFTFEVLLNIKQILNKEHQQITKQTAIVVNGRKRVYEDVLLY